MLFHNTMSSSSSKDRPSNNGNNVKQRVTTVTIDIDGEPEPIEVELEQEEEQGRQRKIYPPRKRRGSNLEMDQIHVAQHIKLQWTIEFRLVLGKSEQIKNQRLHTGRIKESDCTRQTLILTRGLLYDKKMV